MGLSKKKSHTVNGDSLGVMYGAQGVGRKQAASVVGFLNCGQCGECC